MEEKSENLRNRVSYVGEEWDWNRREQCFYSVLLIKDDSSVGPVSISLLMPSMV